MCVLCGEFVMQVHWTERKHDDRSSIVVGDDKLRERQRDRFHRTRLTNQILKHYGLQVNDWSGSKYVLSDRKGSSVVVHDLGGLWPAAEKLLRRPLDPLDPSLIDSLSSKWNESGGNG
jgi:hypothetical protein